MDTIIHTYTNQLDYRCIECKTPRMGGVVKQVSFIAGARSLNVQAEGYHAVCVTVCVHYVALSCCLSAKQMAKSEQCLQTKIRGLTTPQISKPLCRVCLDAIVC